MIAVPQNETICPAPEETVVNQPECAIRRMDGDVPAGAQVCEASLKPCEESRILEANRRLRILQTYDALLAQGRSKASAAKVVETAYVTVWRWRRAFKKKGYNGLLPDTDKCGRKSAVTKLGLTQDVIDQIRGLNLDIASTTGALRAFAQSDNCPEDLAALILDPNRRSKHSLPPSLRQLVKVNPALRQAHQGPRALGLGGIWTPRKMDILPGDIFSSDDTTPIWAWWVPWIECEEYPFGVKLLQGQFLPIIDVASQCVLTYAIIAREKSSYRASDIWSLFGHTFDTIGLPRLGWQLERGTWESNLIAGQELEYQEGEVTLSRRVGGLRQLPANPTPWHREKLGDSPDALPLTLQTWTSFMPKSKSIEAFFNRSQALEGTLWGCVGRDQRRKPNEKAKKLFQTCSRPGAKEDPRHHFLSYTEMVARLNQMLGYLNSEPMEGEVFHGVPQQKFDQARAEYPLLPLPRDMRWLYSRNWKATTITQGWARVRLTHEISGARYSLFYCNPTVFAQHEGEGIVVYYDRENFEQPAHIILARTGEYLCEARYEDRKGSFLAGDRTGHDIRKAWRNAVISAYGTIVKHAPSRQLPPEIAARREAARQLQSSDSDVAAELPSASEPVREVKTAVRIPRRASVSKAAPRTVEPDPQAAQAAQRQREQLLQQARRANQLREAAAAASKTQ
jgi:hypothetical protein